MPQYKHVFFKTLLVFFTLISFSSFGQVSDVGVILLHGKWGNPDTHINKLAEALRNQGYAVSTPLMPWSRKRGYDVPYSTAINEIEVQVNALKANGAKHIIVSGQSLGANAAMAYAAYGHTPIDGIIAIAPGHTPDQPGFKKAVAFSLQRAKVMVTNGKGNDSDIFDDLNGGRNDKFKMKAADYVSYFDPDGMASMPKSAENTALKKVPLLWILGGPKDYLWSAGKAYAFDRWPQHSLNTYMSIDSGHLDAPSASIEAVIAWIQSTRLAALH